MIWPDDLPAPLRSVSIDPGRRAVSNEYGSGRRIVRNWGSVPADMVNIQLRIKSTEESIFNYFWHSTGMDGIWFTADWLQSMGYADHKARFLGYPRRKGVTKTIIDYSITLLIQESFLCVDPDQWPSAGPGAP